LEIVLSVKRPRSTSRKNSNIASGYSEHRPSAAHYQAKLSLIWSLRDETGPLQILRHSLLSRRQAFVHYDPRNFQPEPFRQFFNAEGEPLKLKARDLDD